VRYIETEQSPRDLTQDPVRARQVELEFPGWLQRDLRNKMDMRAILTDDPVTGRSLSSRVTGRVDLFRDIGLTGETELGVTMSGDPLLRAVRLTSSVPVLRRASLQLMYSYQAPGAFVYNSQYFEARLSRSIRLSSR
jgi:hypothetical protein